ncbi:MAG: hypothetical protein A2255_08390 [Candidatus Melainabacteria bacterium RIFOXYA2_FULL_32_9]|nr:MAG: hypothetical protein A2255_08390 [Candidatus Melainabacteria bacterium RIFOXYA2_FULL_32_9]
MSSKKIHISQFDFQSLNQSTKLTNSFADQNQDKTFDLQEIKTLAALVFSCLGSKTKISSYDQPKKNVNNRDYKDIEAQKFIKNFHQIDKGYFRGAVPNIKGIEFLIEYKNVKTVIDLRYFFKNNKQKQENIIRNSGLNYISIPMCPIVPPGIKQIQYFLSIVNNPVNQPVYVHCREGKDRTGIMTAIYRVNKYNYCFDKAFSEMLKFGHHANLFPLLKIWLYNYIDGHKKQISGTQFSHATS